jgi:hypothetical protein
MYGRSNVVNLKVGRNIGRNQNYLSLQLLSQLLGEVVEIRQLPTKRDNVKPPQRLFGRNSRNSCFVDSTELYLS